MHTSPCRRLSLTSLHGTRERRLIWQNVQPPAPPPIDTRNVPPPTAEQQVQANSIDMQATILSFLYFSQGKNAVHNARRDVLAAHMFAAQMNFRSNPNIPQATRDQFVKNSNTVLTQLNWFPSRVVMDPVGSPPRFQPPLPPRASAPTAAPANGPANRTNTPNTPNTPNTSGNRVAATEAARRNLELGTYYLRYQAGATENPGTGNPEVNIGTAAAPLMIEYTYTANEWHWNKPGEAAQPLSAAPTGLNAQQLTKFNQVKGALTGTDTARVQAAERGRQLHKNGHSYLVRREGAAYDDVNDDYTLAIGTVANPQNIEYTFSANEWHWNKPGEAAQPLSAAPTGLNAQQLTKFNEVKGVLAGTDRARLEAVERGRRLYDSGNHYLIRQEGAAYDDVNDDYTLAIGTVANPQNIEYTFSANEWHWNKPGEAAQPLSAAPTGLNAQQLTKFNEVKGVLTGTDQPRVKQTEAGKNRFENGDHYFTHNIDAVAIARGYSCDMGTVALPRVMEFTFTANEWHWNKPGEAAQPLSAAPTGLNAQQLTKFNDVKSHLV